MKKIILIVAAIAIAFAVLLPFASKTPDGFQTMANNYADQQQPVWKGLMAEYSIALGDPYLSSLIAGLIGTGIVLIAGFAMGSIRGKKVKNSRKHYSPPNL